MLAPGLSVGFATSDSGASIAQKILRDCDRNAGAILRDLKAGLITERGLRSTLGAPISQFRGYYNTRLKQIGEPPPHLRFRLATDTPFLDVH